MSKNPSTFLINELRIPTGILTQLAVDFLKREYGSVLTTVPTPHAAFDGIVNHQGAWQAFNFFCIKHPKVVAILRQKFKTTGSI